MRQTGKNSCRVKLKSDNKSGPYSRDFPYTQYECRRLTKKVPSRTLAKLLKKGERKVT